ncbi:MAG TPA: twin-arginine translocase subunit TatC [Streptosporangiaceae bacterium]|nr:twin-arginine translocase subunit TatC [Streptosporangiaceae bacterium]
MEHIRELRNRVLKAVLAMAVGAVVGWFVYPYVWHFIEGPYCKLHVTDTLARHQGCTLYVTGLFDSLFLRLKLAIATGAIISAPLWMYQLWAFIAPGLHSRERRWAYFFAGSAVPLFVLGGGFAYLAMVKGLRFLVGLVPHGVDTIFTINTYLGYAMAMLLIFGLSFELPLIMVLLNIAGVLTHKRFIKWRRMIIFAIFAFAAVATPSPDPISMLLLAVPCVLLVELAEAFAWANDRRRARQGPVYPGLTPAEVAAYGLDQDPLTATDLHDLESAP